MKCPICLGDDIGSFKELGLAGGGVDFENRPMFWCKVCDKVFTEATIPIVAQVIAPKTKPTKTTVVGAPLESVLDLFTVVPHK